MTDSYKVGYSVDALDDLREIYFPQHWAKIESPMKINGRNVICLIVSRFTLRCFYGGAFSA